MLINSSIFFFEVLKPSAEITSYLDLNENENAILISGIIYGLGFILGMETPVIFVLVTISCFFFYVSNMEAFREILSHFYIESNPAFLTKSSNELEFDKLISAFSMAFCYQPGIDWYLKCSPGFSRKCCLLVALIVVLWQIGFALDIAGLLDGMNVLDKIQGTEFRHNESKNLIPFLLHLETMPRNTALTNLNFSCVNKTHVQNMLFSDNLESISKEYGFIVAGFTKFGLGMYTIYFASSFLSRIDAFFTSSDQQSGSGDTSFTWVYRFSFFTIFYQLASIFFERSTLQFTPEVRSFMENLAIATTIFMLLLNIDKNISVFSLFVSSFIVVLLCFAESFYSNEPISKGITSMIVVIIVEVIAYITSNKS
ncbi:hypothetical protein Ciccas_002845 [Cichlidogyrus casuarinus]|uniref:Uncharacterized protein n=1 Tax=Cichlidogyrus casuarinus TaxID=1844966 RepID=A0ABD2QG28_9PLAT